MKPNISELCNLYELVYMIIDFVRADKWRIHQECKNSMVHVTLDQGK